MTNFEKIIEVKFSHRKYPFKSAVCSLFYNCDMCPIRNKCNLTEESKDTTFAQIEEWLKSEVGGEA